ncbi:UDP-glucose 4-epimerase GalE [Escherichia coli]|uniref:UDP-glucose 4-epimerase GalE n=1 Tax=Escherichia coli TaxID=562 RepID=UPI001C5309A6|nr:UDP-glucose 4-epimerase GalE [Escherichia coli]MBW1124516.1 UDP-glucose 4-epimerase GalE [Escherichia coli]
MNILVTGGAGYIGSHTSLCLLNKGYNVVIIDNLINSSCESIRRIELLAKKKVVFYELNINNEKKVNQILKKHKVDCVMHFAGAKSVAESLIRPIFYYDNNVAGTLQLINCAIKNDVANFIFSSSATVYGESKIMPVTEDCHIGGTLNPYDTSKYISELMIRDIAKKYSDTNFLCLRYFNPTGAHESGMIGESPADIPSNLVPYILQVAMGKLEKLMVFGGDYPTKDGTGVRDYIHVMDLAEGHVAALSYLFRDNNTNYHVFNLGTGKGYSVLELVSTFEKISGVRIPYEIVSRREGDIAESWSSPEKANKYLNWKAKRELETMLEDAWRWQMKNPNGYK